MRSKKSFVPMMVSALVLAMVSLAPMPGAAQSPSRDADAESGILQTLAGNAFTYQGYLTYGGRPADGLYDFSFSLYADAAGTQWVADAAPLDNVPVVHGLFTALVDVTDAMYGDVYFYLNGDARWLKIGVRSGASTGAYTYLSPLQPLTPAPYALALPGLNTIQNDTSPNVIGGYSWNYVDPNAVGATIGGGGSSGARNEVLRNYGTVGGGLDNTAGGLGATVDGGAYGAANGDMSTVSGGQQNTADGYAAAIGGGQWNTTNGSYATVAGGAGNSAGAAYATVGGGGWTTPAQESTANRVTDEYGTVAGGGNNRAGNADADLTNARFATVGGGRLNVASGDEATVCGGASNSAGGANAAVGGGEGNTAAAACAVVAGGCGNMATGISATVAGGEVNFAQAPASTVGGGSGNTADGSYATVPGGRDNYARGSYSLAAGRRAKANHAGSFVWADSTDADFASAATNQFRVRATNGAYLSTNTSTDGLWVQNDSASGDGIHVQANVSMGTGWGAVYAYNYGTSPAVRADSAGTYSGYFRDDIYVEGNCVGCTLVYIGLNAGDVPLEIGDLVTIVAAGAPLEGTTVPVLRVRLARAGDAVVGVVQSRAKVSKSGQDGQSVASAERVEGAAASGEYLFIVVEGLAQVKADTSGGVITPGQRLTASEQAGHARALQTRLVEGMMVAEGAPVVGIALSSLDAVQGTGLIPVLVTLH